MPAYTKAQLRKYETRNKQALFVPTKQISRLFQRSAFDPRIWVTDDVEKLLGVVSRSGRVGSRLPQKNYKGLENDPSRQQIILYTLVLDRDLQHMLIYRRADKTTVPAAQLDELGDKRLRG